MAGSPPGLISQFQKQLKNKGQATVRREFRSQLLISITDLGQRIAQAANRNLPPITPLRRFTIGNKIHVGGGVSQRDQGLIGV